MIPTYEQQIQLKNRPSGSPQLSDFQLVQVPLAALEEGQILVQNIYMSVDPYMRNQMRARRSYAAGFEINQPLRGIDIYFDNVGGSHLEAALSRMNNFGRIAACGMIAQYNTEQPVPGPRNLALIVTKRLRMEGFIISDHPERRAQFLADMSRWIQEGQIRWEETIVEGLENAPQAFIGLFEGQNLGKMLVQISSSP